MANKSQIYFVRKPSSSSGAPFQTDKYIATAGQLVFLLTQMPASPVNVVFSINGQIATPPPGPGNDYNIFGTIITWLNTDFVLQAGDEVVAYYETV